MRDVSTVHPKSCLQCNGFGLVKVALGGDPDRVVSWPCTCAAGDEARERAEDLEARDASRFDDHIDRLLDEQQVAR